MSESCRSVPALVQDLARLMVVGASAMLAVACRPPLAGLVTPTVPSEPGAASVSAVVEVTPTRLPDDGVVPATSTPDVAESISAEPSSFDAFVDQATTAQLRRDPELVSEYGLADALGMDNSQLTDLSDAYQLETYALYEAQLGALRRFDRTALSPEQQLTSDILEWELENQLAGQPYRFYNHPVKQVLGIHTQLLELMTDRHPMQTRKDAEDYILRLEQFPVKIDQLLSWLELQHAQGIVMPAFAIRNVVWQMDQFVAIPAERTELYTVFVQKLDQVDDLDDDARSALGDRALVAIEEQAQPAYGRLQGYFRSLQAEAPKEGGLYALPGGAEAYAYALRYHTTTDLSADEIHALGLKEVTRLQMELSDALSALGIEDGELADRVGQAAMQGGSVPAGQVLDTYTELIEDAGRNLDPWFDVRPEASVVMASADYAGAAYYVSPSLDGTRPGTFYAGVGGSSWRFAMPTLAYHEAVPGHHFQLALAQELTALPTFRRITVHTAYAEGWALYAERLAWEAGWYAEDPYGDIGRLQAELFRAVRLVVDTGIHAQGWTRQAAIDYLIKEAAHPPEMSRNEAERYILWPGQATAYKVGMLKILELRARAQTAMGDDFDILEFHSRVLSEGSLPLPILDQQVSTWVNARQD